MSARPAPKVCALIPARGGSKGIPGKNIKPFRGRPLLAHSVEAARRAPGIDRVLVSTDDPAIEAAARDAGAETLRRPDALSGDTASSESALLHALDHLHATEGYVPDAVVFLQATSPLRRPTEVQDALDHFFASGADSLFSATPAHGFAWSRDAAGVVTPVDYDPVHRPRRQEMTTHLVHENGSIYVFRPWVLRELGSRLGGHIACHLMDPLDSYEIDEPEDWDLLERLATVRRPGDITPEPSR